MGKRLRIRGAATGFYLLNIPEIDYLILEILLSAPTKRIGIKDIQDAYRAKDQKPPTNAAFSQSIGRLKQRRIIKVERHSELWIEYTCKEIEEQVGKTFANCRVLENLLKLED